MVFYCRNLHHGIQKSQSRLQNNLARIIEERLKDICEWVKKEIKEAGCGSRFAPTVLITGGGAEMQNIEDLFASELGYEDVRSVYPEYGFTDSIHEHMATRAYATVASLLLYGAKRGSCAVAERPKISTPEPQPRVTPHSGYQQQEMPIPPRPISTPAPEQPKSSNAEVVVPPQKLTPVMPEVDDDTTEQTTDEPIIDIPETNTNTQNRIGRLFDRLADMFAGNDKGDDQII
jgi:cell division ATPase FtsA